MKTLKNTYFLIQKRVRHHKYCFNVCFPCLHEVSLKKNIRVMYTRCHSLKFIDKARFMKAYLNWLVNDLSDNIYCQKFKRCKTPKDCRECY